MFKFEKRDFDYSIYQGAEKIEYSHHDFKVPILRTSVFI